MDYYSVGFFIVSNVMVFLITPSSNSMLLYSYTLSRTRWNYLMVTTTCIPIFWLLSRLLEKLVFFLDQGALTCGPAFHFEDTKSMKLARACGVPAVGVRAVDCWQ